MKRGVLMRYPDGTCQALHTLGICGLLLNVCVSSWSYYLVAASLCDLRFSWGLEVSARPEMFGNLLQTNQTGYFDTLMRIYKRQCCTVCTMQSGAVAIDDSVPAAASTHAWLQPQLAHAQFQRLSFRIILCLFVLGQPSHFRRVKTPCPNILLVRAMIHSFICRFGDSEGATATS